MVRKTKIKKDLSKLSNEELLDFQELAHSFHGQIEKFNDYIKFHEMSEDFQIEMFKLVDNFINSDETILKIACLGCKGGGKSSNMILIALMTLITYDGDCMLHYISGKESQSKSVLINEVESLLHSAKHHNKELNELLEVTATSVTNKITGKSISILTYSVAKGGITTAGIHCNGLHLFILDEAPSIMDKVYLQVLGTAATGKSIYLCAGNPDDDNPNFFWRVMTDEEDGDECKYWHRFNINYYDLKRPSEKQKEGMVIQYPQGTPAYTKYVLGQYAETDESRMIDPDKLKPLIHIPTVQWNSIGRLYHLDMPFNLKERVDLGLFTIIGVDVSTGSGKDYHVISALSGTVIEVMHYNNTEPLDRLKFTIQQLYMRYSVFKHKGMTRNVYIVIDADGAGKALCSMLSFDTKIKYAITPFHNREGLEVHPNYKDRRSEVYAKFAHWLTLASINEEIKEYSEGGSNYTDYQIIIHKSFGEEVSRKIINEAKQTKYLIKDEGKKQMLCKKELPYSTDILDSISYTFYHYECDSGLI